MNKSGTFYKNISKGINLRIKQIFKNPFGKVNINWFLLKYLKHLPPNRVHNHKLFNHETFFYGGSEYLHGLREIFIEEIYNQKLPEKAFIIDCGSHIGLSIIYLKKICPTASIVAFEPDLKNYTLLQKNILSHKLTSVTSKNEAVWIENTNLNFIQDGNMGSKIGSDSTGNTKSVKAVRLKEELNRKVDFLKLDIEGAEYDVLKDIADNLNNVIKLFIEYHGNFDENNKLLEIFRIVTKAGFTFYIKEAAKVYAQPFLANREGINYDLQLNIFCFRNL